MIDESVVELGLKYLDGCIASGEQPTLRAMINFIAYYDRLVANTTTDLLLTSMKLAKYYEDAAQPLCGVTPEVLN